MLIDITRPPYRGRIISLGPNDDRFISFKYERLPNICYWCGLVSHDDKECSLWLSSKGSLKVDDQQFGPWIRATQINPTRKSVMEVKGFNKTEVQHHSRFSRTTGASSSSVQERNLSLMPVSGSAIETTAIDDSRIVMELVPVGVEGQCEPVRCDEDQLQQITTTMKEDDVTLEANKVPAVAKGLNEECVSSNSLTNTAYVTGSKENLSVLWNLGLSETVPSNVIIDPPHVVLKVDHSKLSSYETHTSQPSTNSPPRIGATIDQGTQILNTEDKAIEDEDKHTYTARRGMRTTGIRLERGNKSKVKTGRWTRFTSRVGVDNLQPNTVSRSGTKRNFSGTFEAMVVDTVHEKKPKFREDSDEHGDFLTTQLGSAEVVEQPYREQ